MRKFELFMGCHGHGITVCNKAVYENGDYKYIAHISPAGNIKYYVSRSYIPDIDLMRIENAAAREKEKTVARLDLELSQDYGLYRAIDEICDYTPYKTWNKLLNDIRDQSREATVNAVKKCYLANF